MKSLYISSILFLLVFSCNTIQKNTIKKYDNKTHGIFDIKNIVANAQLCYLAEKYSNTIYRNEIESRMFSMSGAQKFILDTVINNSLNLKKSDTIYFIQELTSETSLMSKGLLIYEKTHISYDFKWEEFDKITIKIVDNDEYFPFFENLSFLSNPKFYSAIIKSDPSKRDLGGYNLYLGTMLIYNKKKDCYTTTTSLFTSKSIDWKRYIQ